LLTLPSKVENFVNGDSDRRVRVLGAEEGALQQRERERLDSCGRHACYIQIENRMITPRKVFFKMTS
jgi:hypothetical protein